MDQGREREADAGQVPARLHSSRRQRHCGCPLPPQVHLKQTVLEIHSQNLILSQICQHVLYARHSEGYVDKLMGKLTSAKRV